HFIVYYKAAPEDFIKQLIDKSEDYYNRIAQDLGFTRYDFWTWDKRAKIYIHDNAANYQAATAQPSWSIGCAQVAQKIIQTFPYAKGFFETVLPHEMGHIIFREFIGLGNSAIPLWLEEGVASYQEKIRYRQANMLIKEAINEGEFINLRELSSVNPQLMSNPQLADLFYAESFSVVDFLIKEFGRDKFVLFCQNLRDKKNLERALVSTYSFSNIQELNDAWVRYLNSQ
ncbi:MAG: peptidase MA family metallohydrolase, partial [Candidatus Omnitrophica bacterium]|nr:peptidase MA family metallohydrolase [Candidatus Omnitrophota bacterium]